MKKKSILAIGLMSGTSADGVDASLVEITGKGLNRKVDLLSHKHTAFSKELTRLIHEVSAPGHGSTELICHLNFLLGKKFATTAIQLAKDAKVSMDQISLIGSHGQTVYHIPREVKGTVGKDERYGYRTPSTLQLGEPSVIAETTGVTTVADFRPRDMAAGGEGAPLTPYAHLILFGKIGKPVIVNNLGGISNITYIPKSRSLEKVIAFDTGPANMVIDSLTSLLTEGKKRFDQNGRMAKKGEVDEFFMRRLMANRYFRTAPPKSTGRESFGMDFARTILHQGRIKAIPPEDLMASVTNLTARSISLAYRNFVMKDNPVEEAIFCGGGTKNKTLMAMIKEAVDPLPVKITDDYGIPVDAIESMAFAIFAHATLLGEPSTIPMATGATTSVIAGKIVPGPKGIGLV